MSSLFLKLLKVNAPVSSRRLFLRSLRTDWSEKEQVISSISFFCLLDNTDQKGVDYFNMGIVSMLEVDI